MEAEVIALAHSCHKLFPIVDMDKYISGEVGLTILYTTMNVSIHEDNAISFVFMDTLSPQFTTCGKYYDSKNIWFQ